MTKSSRLKPLSEKASKQRIIERQKRLDARAEVKKRILRAGEQILRAQGVNKVNVRNIANTLGVSIPYIYTYFEGGLLEIKRKLKHVVQEMYPTYSPEAIDTIILVSTFGLETKKRKEIEDI
jgi:hypothetical protein